MLGARVLSRRETKRVMAELKVEEGLSQKGNMVVGAVITVEKKVILKETAGNV